jgi:hypothetical protein
VPDEPVPVRRAAVGCLIIAVVGLGLAALVRPVISTFAPPRGDDGVIVATLAEVTEGPIARDQLLTRSYGHDGERDAGGGRVQLTLILAESAFGGVSAVNGASPVQAACPVEIGADRLVDCADRAWTYDGLPIDPADPPLDRFPVEVDSGSVVVDLTRTLEE